MEDINLTIFNDDALPHALVVDDYIIAIKRYPGGTIWEPHQMYDRYTQELLRAKARDIFRERDRDGYKLIIPEALSAGIIRYDSKSRGVYNEVELENELRSSIRHQRVRPKMDETHRKLQLELRGGQIFMHPRIAESIEFSILSKEKASCSHTPMNCSYEVLLSGGMNVGAGTCYDLSGRIKLKVIGDVDQHRHSRPDVLGRMIHVGDPRVINRENRVEAQQFIDRSIAPSKFPLKQLIFDRRKALDADVRIMIREEDASAELNEMGRQWMGDQRVNIVEDVIQNLVKKGNRQEKIPHRNEREMQARFRNVITTNLQDQRRGNEVQNIRQTPHQADEKKFAAVLLMTGCDIVKRTIWSDEETAILRGLYEYAHDKLGCVYHAMKRDFRWSIRPTYTDGCANICDRKRTIMVREDYFDLQREEGDSIYKWMVSEWDKRDVKIHAREGYLYSKYSGADEDDVLVHDIDDRLYATMVDRVLANGWIEKEGLYQIIKEGVRLETFDFTKDAYINESGFLVLPEYYDKIIASNIYDCKFKISRVSITSSNNDDPWEKKTAEGVIDEQCLWKVPLPNLIDVRPCLRGELLTSNNQEYSKRFENTIEELKKDEQVYEEFKPIREGEQACIQGHVCRYLFYGQKIRVFSILKRYYPIERILELSSEEDFDYDLYLDRECYGMELKILELRSITSLICLLIDFGYEGRTTLRKESEYMKIFNEVSYATHKRKEALNRYFPRYYQRLIRVREAEDIEDILPLIFLQALLLSDPCTENTEKNSHPLFLFCSEDIKIVPIRTATQERGLPLMHCMHILKFHPGLQARKKELADDLKKMLPAIYSHWIEVEMKRLDTGDRLRTRKQIAELYYSTNCGGSYETLNFVFPIVHPNKGFVACVISSKGGSGALNEDDIKRRFKDIKNSIRGIFSINIDEGPEIQLHHSGDVQARILEKVFFEHKWHVVQVKLNGKIFENHELITKLMN
ncbi:VP2 protein [Epizootic hemorrhagic disease virus 1]|uniref:Outer capsid protein VP2 n=1 Tax=Epizootic hemorrhagic disease virus 1 TaxID=33720 RepID=A0A1L7NT38_EHDV1|nr:VP2 protein [Epizootic hemorrhagic disease virus 1]